ncbi:GTP-binding protein [Candidatus Thorarchaeota archaeon]|nr:MAG: GTP-binding protein [Candidatus Thorarchaeota archaeon]
MCSHLIHNVILIDKTTGEVVTRVRFWKIDFADEDIHEFMSGYTDLMDTEGLSPDTPVYVSEHKVFHSLVDDDMQLLLVTDGRDEDRTIMRKAREGAARISTALRGNSIGYVKDNLDDILDELVFTRFKVSFVGSGGVGKSTLLRLLFGKEPAPGGYVATINVAVDSSETIQFGTFLVTIWDFAGQAVFQDLWAFYFSGTDVIFLITDSSFRNVMQTKSLLRTIRKEAPAVPLFIIANKQDLPESMRAEKIQRLLGAPTFPMVATDKTRRDEFIRLMLDVATKTVGVELPDRPLSEMITVHRKDKETELPPRPGDIPAGAATSGEGTGEWIEAKESGSSGSSSGTAVEARSGDSAIDYPVNVETETETVVEIPDKIAEQAQVLHVIMIVQNNGMFNTCYELNYAEQEVDATAIASLISALDSFGGIDGDPSGMADKSDALKRIEHEGNLVMVEKSDHFVLGVTVNNDSEEEKYRKIMSSLLIEFEQEFDGHWESWDGDVTVFEPTVFSLLNKMPMRPVSFDYVVRPREAGQPLSFDSREVGRSLVEVKTAIEGSETVGGLVRSLNLPRENVIGALQIMEHFGWLDFQVNIGPQSVPRKVKNPDPDTVKAYGSAVVKFVDFCDGETPLEDVVKKVGVSYNAMKFVATKLVLSGVLEIVA